MAHETPTYDLTLLLDAKAEESERKKIVSEIEGLITKTGEIVDRRDWGIRQTTFRINHETEADYYLRQFSGPSELLSQLDHNLKIMDGIVRFRIIKVTPGTPPIPDLTREVIATNHGEDETNSSTIPQKRTF
jgi:small subunit ribosomal protein S6